MSHTITIEDIVSKTTDLPTIPAAAIKVMRETDSSTSNAATIASTLAQDQALSVRVLRLANSAYYGLSRRVSDLQEAVVVLGMRSVKNLAMVAATYPWMSRPVTGYCLGPRQMWTHAFGTAIASQLVAKVSRTGREDTAFTAGLLHDLGKVALSIWLENKINAILLYASRENLSFDQAERKVLGFDHCQVGEYLGESWNLPEDIVRAIRFHHAPASCQAQDSIVDCVHVGNYLTMSMGFGLGGDGLLYEFDEEVFARLGITESDLTSITDTYVEAYEQYARLFEDLAAA